MHEHRALKPRPTGGVLIPPRSRQSMDTKKLPIRLREGELLNGARGGNRTPTALTATRSLV